MEASHERWEGEDEGAAGGAQQEVAPPPLWRSLLYVPANVERFIESAHTRGADAIILDLEDSVPPAKKLPARDALQDSAHRVARGGADVLVRINRPLGLAVRDVEATVSPEVRGLLISKVEGPDHVRLLALGFEEYRHESEIVIDEILHLLQAGADESTDFQNRPIIW